MSGNDTGTGTDDASGKMRTMIAYSAIDVGAMIYGNSGIRALYDDANELGWLIAANGTAAYLNDPGVLKAISDIIAEYAGLLANNKDIVADATSGNTGHEKGALFYDQDNNRLIGDFSRTPWQVTDGANTGQQADIIGKKTLTDAVSIYGSLDASSSINEAIANKWGGSTSHIVKMVAATTDSPATLDAVNDAQIGQDENAQPDDGAMLIGAGADDTLIGGDGKDLLIGGEGKDTFIGGQGDDLMFGGAGDDTFQGYDASHTAPGSSQNATGYEGNDWIDGGSGNDTVDYSSIAGGQAVAMDPKLTLGAENPQVGGRNTIKVEDGTGGEDILVSIERGEESARTRTAGATLHADGLRQH